MRLQENEKLAIKESCIKIFSVGKIYLFGSRVDDDSRIIEQEALKEGILLWLKKYA
ncbi:MAG: hypothetical protein JEZ04_10930 [Spirochaetales bacterium]|nr:hypothetical protein [Spirochaetales bacterium]